MALPGVDPASGQDDVLVLEGCDQRQRRQTEFGEARIRRLQEDALVLHAVQLDPVDARQRIELFTDVPGHPPHLRRAEAIAGQRQRDNRDVAEIVVDKGVGAICSSTRGRIARGAPASGSGSGSVQAATSSAPKTRPEIDVLGIGWIMSMLAVDARWAGSTPSRAVNAAGPDFVPVFGLRPARAPLAANAGDADPQLAAGFAKTVKSAL
jgi:hypothetical protein